MIGFICYPVIPWALHEDEVGEQWEQKDQERRGEREEI